MQPKAFPWARVSRLARIGSLSMGLSAACFQVGPVFAKSGYPASVEASIEDAKKDCSPDTAIFEKGFVATKDINGDGVPDYILDYLYYGCNNSHSFYCGSAGCLTEVFSSTGHGGYVKALSENVRGIRFAKSGGRPAMFLDLHGSACGKVGSAPCNKTLYWNGSNFTAAR